MKQIVEISSFHNPKYYTIELSFMDYIRNIDIGLYITKYRVESYLKSGMLNRPLIISGNKEFKNNLISKILI